MKLILTAVSCVCFSAAAFAAPYRCDFNKDGYEDLPVGNPDETVSSFVRNGAVRVIYGSQNGLSSTRKQLWHRDVSGVVGTNESGAGFGNSLTCGDFDRDGYSDLAIGVSNAKTGSGSITVLYGSSSGLSAAGNQLWNQNSSGIPDSPEAQDHFGASLASGDFNADGFADVAIGVPGESLFGLRAEGAVHILYGSSGIGLTSAQNQFLSQNTSGIANSSEEDDQFGHTLAAANFGRDSASRCYDDLVVSSFEMIGPPDTDEEGPSHWDHGAVNVIYGSSGGLTSAGNQIFHQGLTTLPDDPEPRDHFGLALAAGVFRGTASACGGKISDLAIGIPGENNDDFDSGAVQVLYSTTSGLSTSGNQLWNQGSPGVPDGVATFEFFGKALATGRSSSGRDYLAIGSPGEDIGTAEGAGMVHVLFSDATTKKLSAAGARLFHQNSSGVPDSAEGRDLLGTALSTGNYNGSGADDLAIGVPGDGSAVTILYSASTSATQFLSQLGVVLKNSDVKPRF